MQYPEVIAVAYWSLVGFLCGTPFSVPLMCHFYHYIPPHFDKFHHEFLLKVTLLFCAGIICILFIILGLKMKHMLAAFLPALDADPWNFEHYQDTLQISFAAGIATAFMYLKHRLLKSK